MHTHGKGTVLPHSETRPVAPWPNFPLSRIILSDPILEQIQKLQMERTYQLAPWSNFPLSRIILI